MPIALAEASGSFVRDVDGNVFIDFLTGAGVGEGRVRRRPAVELLAPGLAAP
jgi:acetylornithine/succinyldiaminopimelate/putrescine aminotransferase